MNARAFWIPALLLAALVTSRAAGTDDSTFPPVGYAGDRYAPLWTKSPFAIATADAPVASADYALVGLAQFDGVSYASLIDKSNSEHFVLASNKPVRGLSLVSVTHQSGAASATIRHNGEMLTLRVENTAASPPPLPPPAAEPQNGAFSNVGGGAPANTLPPPVRFHRRPIIVPPRPQ